MRGDVIYVEIPRRTLDVEIDRLREIAAAIEPGKSVKRIRALSAVVALEWLRDGTVEPSKAFA